MSKKTLFAVSVDKSSQPLKKKKYRTLNEAYANSKPYKFIIVTPHGKYIHCVVALNYEMAERLVVRHCVVFVHLYYGDLYSFKFLDNDKITPFEAEFYSYEVWQKNRVSLLKKAIYESKGQSYDILTK